MKALGYAPKVASCEKCAHTIAWPRVLGELAQGTLMFGWWSPDSKFPGTDHVMAVWSKKYGMTTDLETAASNFGFTQVLLDAIKRSGTADPKAINKALGETNLASVVGPVKFANNTRRPSRLHAAMAGRQAGAGGARGQERREASGAAARLRSVR